MGGNPINQILIPFKLLNGGAKLPEYGSAEAAGADLFANFLEDTYPKKPDEWVYPLQPGERRVVKTGVAIELPPGFEAQVRPRSGNALKLGLTVLNTPGTIDPDYRGDIGVILYNASDKVISIEHGMKIAQLVVAPFYRAIFQASEKLSETERGEGGFGSTGK